MDPCQHALPRLSGLRMDERRPIRRVAAEILSKQSMGGPAAGVFCGLLTVPTC